MNARIGWQYHEFELAVFGRNLTDEVYFANAINFRYPPNGPDFFVGTPGDPMIVGVAAAVRF